VVGPDVMLAEDRPVLKEVREFPTVQVEAWLRCVLIGGFLRRVLQEAAPAERGPRLMRSRPGCRTLGCLI
jgi:hypothetical protein